MTAGEISPSDLPERPSNGSSAPIVGLMGRSTLGPERRNPDPSLMSDHIELLATGTTDEVALDVRDETQLLAADRAEYDVDGVRALLAAINLQPAVMGRTEPRRAAEVMDLAIYRATGSRRLARIFGTVS